MWTEGRVKPVIDRTFPIEQVAEAQRDRKGPGERPTPGDRKGIGIK
jgi:NADPH:quinone reductase-like Zn-dependent oxidoreductase